MPLSKEEMRPGKLLILFLAIFVLFSTVSFGQSSSSTVPTRTYSNTLDRNRAHVGAMPQRYRHSEPIPGQIYGNLNISPSAAWTSPSGSFLSSTYFVGTTVQATSTTYEAEEHIAVHSFNPGFVLAAISDFSIPRYGFTGNTTKYAWSRNGGFTWNESFMELDQTANRAPITGDGITWQRMSDPVVAIDSKNNIAYTSNLYFDVFDNANGAYVSASPIHNGNVTFTAAATHPVAVNTDPNTGFFEDKEWVTVDNSWNRRTSGRVYVAWVHYLDLAHQPFGGEIHVATSKDHAATFKPAVVVSPAGQVNAVQAPQVAVDRLGRVVVSWTYCLNYSYDPNIQFNAICLQSQIWGAVSTDGGSTFSAPVQISPTMNDLDGSGFPSHYRKWSAPAMAVDPVSGSIAVVYIDQPGPNSVVEYVLCPPAFSSACAAPQAINDASDGQRVFPAVAVDNLGIVHVSWYDSRNASSDPYSSQLDVYATFALSVHKPFHANARVTPSTIDFDSRTFIGDYTGTAARWGIARPAWTNGYLQSSLLLASP
jgi:hypothetical protein